ncbi:hypothetical protein TWF173_004483 [Orbilia oligospora]|nr:hypothetical protein TWF173_004483 [Orbilia oligospora]
MLLEKYNLHNEETILTMKSIGGHYQSSGRSSESLQWTHRESFLIMNQIGITLGVRGNSGESLQMYTRALIGLAGADFIQDAQDRFVNRNREILSTEVKLIGEEDLTPIYTSGALMISLAENRKYEEALELCSHFIPRLLSIYDENDWSILNTLYYQAMALFGQSNYDEARQILEMVISRVKNTYGEDHTFVYQSIRLLGQVLEKQGHDDETMTYFEQAYSGSARFFGNNHYEVQHTAQCIRYLREKLDRVPEV